MSLDWSAYRAISLDAGLLAAAPEPPAEHHLAGVPWIAHARAYCQSTSLQMIAQWRSGRPEKLGLFNWLMGFTYGAGHLKGSCIFLPYDDPEAGFRFAAPSLGLEHRYLVTDDQDAWIKAMKASLTAGRPLRIMVDSATLKGREDYFSPHSVVVVGYRGDLACVYETRMDDRRDEGAEGQPVPWARIAAAARRVSQIYRYPWAFQFTCFEPRPPAALSFEEVCARNGGCLIGADGPWAATGSHALRSLARELEEQRPKLGEERPPGWKDLKLFFEYGAYTRADNADFLRADFAASREMGRAADCLGSAGLCYDALVAALEEPAAAPATVAAALVDQLGRAAELEAEAGRWLLAAARQRGRITLRRRRGPRRRR
jgi:hypothetical protein